MPAGSKKIGNAVLYGAAGLVALLLLALFFPKVAVFLILILIGLAIVGYGAFKAILKVPSLRISVLRIMLANVNKLDENSEIYRIYLGLIGILGGKKPRLYSLQPALPHLPVPQLESTVSKFLNTVKPLISESEFEATTAAAEEFKKGAGRQLQQALIQRAADPKINNWLEEYWESFIYLRGRKPLNAFSNWYGTDRINAKPEQQLDRATNLIVELMFFHRMVESQELEPIRLMGTVPFCMWQYSRIFCTTRNPGKEQDALITYPINASNYIMVIRKGQIWKVQVSTSDGKIISRKGIKSQLNAIMEKSEDESEKPIGSFTGQDRTLWADIREQLAEAGNKEALETIDKALFVVALESVTPANLEEEAVTSWLRNTQNRWYDKSFTLIVYANGRIGLNVEHTWADAPVLVHMFDFIFGIEDAAGEGTRISDTIPEPQRITWKTTPKIEEALKIAIPTADALSQAISLKIYFFEPYGKGFIKQLKVSPDGYVQMAFQLAYYTMYDKLVLTYESAHTRQFAHGRTETVRSASNEALEFVKAMKDRLRPAKEKLQLLRKAIEGHVAYMKTAMTGNGVDRHLLGLYLTSKLSGMETPALFADKAWSLDFKLATSQTPGVRTTGGGFAPMCFDGYGISYLVAEDRLTFHITNYTSCPDTSVDRFAEALGEALNQMRAISIVTSEMRRSLSQGELPQA